MNQAPEAKPDEPSAKGARRLLWALVLGVVVLNLLIFLATMRQGADAPATPDSTAGSPTNPR